MDVIVVKENDISRSQRKYCEHANHQILSNNDRLKGLGLAKKLQLSDVQQNVLNDSVIAAACRYHRIAAEKFVKTLQSYVSEQKSIDVAIRSLKLDVDHLNSQIIRLEQLRTKLEKNAISDNQFVYNLTQANTNVKLLENRLLVAQQKENHFKQENVKLLQVIRNLCDERIKFNDLWAKVVNRLLLDKRMLIDMTDQAVLAFEKGTEYRKRMDFIAKSALLAKNDHIEEMSTILRSLHLDTIRENFFVNKMHRIPMKQLNEKEVERRTAFRRFLTRTQNAYEITLNEVRIKSSQTKIDAIVAEFAKQKREYFSEFCYLNDLQFRVMQMHTILTKVKRQANEGVANQVPLKQKKKAKMVLEASVARAKVENQESESELRALNESLERYYHVLSTIVEHLKCDRTNLSLPKDFKNDEVHMHNVGTFLSLVEHRLKQIMSFVFYLELNSRDSTSMVINDVDVINHLLNELEIEPIVHECAECAMEAEATGHEAQTPLDVTAIRDAMMVKALTPEMAYRMHNISQCELPRCRALLAKSIQR